MSCMSHILVAWSHSECDHPCRSLTPSICDVQLPKASIAIFRIADFASCGPGGMALRARRPYHKSTYAAWHCLGFVLSTLRSFISLGGPGAVLKIPAGDAKSKLSTIIVSTIKVEKNKCKMIKSDSVCRRLGVGDLKTQKPVKLPQTQT